MAGLSSGIAMAQNAHYIKLSAELNTNTGCVDINLKEAGLGNSGVQSVIYAVSATGSFTAVCVTKQGNNIVQGQPKSGSGSATSFNELFVRNGSTSGTVSLCPSAFSLPDPGCTGSQRLEIISVAYSNVTLNDQLPADITAGVRTLGSFGPETVAIFP